MTTRTIALLKNLPPVLERFSVEELYHVALCLGNELRRRAMDCEPEARALELALLVGARLEHRLIFSGDCVTRTSAPVEGAWAGRPVEFLEPPPAIES